MYSLYDLLGEEAMHGLVKGTRFEQAECLVLKESRSMVAAQLQLLQLHAFEAECSP